MKTIQRRDKLMIYGDLLSALCYESGEEKIVPTKIQAKIGVPFDRLKTYIKELVDQGLVENETSMRLTEKGIDCVREYQRVFKLMELMGLSYR